MRQPTDECDPELVSICIPTCERPALLAAALASCAAQGYASMEIVIGDDSRGCESEETVLRHQRRYGGNVRYEHNVPPLGQAGNVNRLFARARGARLVLLHDDDTLEPDALETLAQCWSQNSRPTAAFGKQWLMDHSGVVLCEPSAALNRFYHRIPANAGLQAVPAIAGISRMFPNDGYMVDTAAARAVGYRSSESVGSACDFDFGLRLCLGAHAIHFVDRELARYRITDESISRSSFPALASYAILRATSVPPQAAAARQNALAQLAPQAASALARQGRASEALRVIFSPYYSWRKRLSARGVYHLLLALKAFQATGRRVTGA